MSIGNKKCDSLRQSQIQMKLMLSLSLLKMAKLSQLFTGVIRFMKPLKRCRIFYRGVHNLAESIYFLAEIKAINP